MKDERCIICGCIMSSPTENVVCECCLDDIAESEDSEQWDLRKIMKTRLKSI